MTLVLTLILFLSASLLLLDLYTTVKNAQVALQQVYAKTQALYVFRSALPLALAILRTDDPSVDHLGERWAYPLSFKTERGELTLTIYDEDRFINLNTAGEHQELFKHLFSSLRIEQEYLDRLLLWIGKKEGSFESQYPIKRAPLHSKEELLYVGFKPEDLQGKTLGENFYPGLWSLTTTFSSGRVNLNTAPLHVLTSLDRAMDYTLASKIVERRARQPFRKPEDLVMVEGFTLDMLYRMRNYVDTKSRFFHVVMDLRSGGYSLSFSAIYDRQEGRFVYKKIQ
ncbi:MAG: general secretion pathway protein GspK [Aquificaceae bacterium]|nr:general secretion pathway protein GspK [Aquificaceae bacterium]MCS7196955.1 general secretion pathway protein GspK [Aquificaceae bacterium]MCX7989320.1 general secretion pathway protein GspK [Aquificaceae bacterium]MDW8032266.1 type II secretion system protein GspK [Aquificaceae bacterium]